MTPTSMPPATAPIREPTLIGATVSVRAWRSVNAPRHAYRSTPTMTVGRLTKRLPVPAVLMSAPKAKTSVGIINSPPATPRRLLTSPIASPKMTPAPMCQGSVSGRNPGSVWGRSPSIIRARPMHTRKTRMTRSSRSSESLEANAGPINAVMTAPARSAPSAGRKRMSAANESVRLRCYEGDCECDEANRQVQRHGLPRGITKGTDQHREAKLRPPRPIRPPRRPIGTA